MKVGIVGIGHSKFGNRELSLRELAFEAAKEAFEDAGILQKEIDALVTSIAADEFSFALQPSAQVADYLGIVPKPNIRVEGACASGSQAVRTGWLTVASGLADKVLVVGAEKMTEVSTSLATEIMGRGGDSLWEYPFGLTFPGYYAMMAVSHMKRYGTREEHLAKVACKNHRYGAMNPYAHLQKEVSVEKALSSRMIAYPLRLFDCSLISDGAAAIILAEEREAKKICDAPVWITGLGCATDFLSIMSKELTTLSAAREAAKVAYKMAGVSPLDVDVAVVHDCFTIAELIAYEDLGFCKAGESKRMIDEGETELGGRIPVNIDGGLKSKGHPIGATGVSMAVEITKQLRGEAGKRQVDGAEIGLSHNVGGSGQIALVHIYNV
jgi:acetyl-CoA C-acetyltransferase